ncbi:hypothetical protein TNCV_1043451 [Trichonephila clavipes]|nr:hypothetical protein TNCV_1043451 [Trichonephila clavipes]
MPSHPVSRCVSFELHSIGNPIIVERKSQSWTSQGGRDHFSDELRFTKHRDSRQASSGKKGELLSSVLCNISTDLLAKESLYGSS